MSAAGVTLSYDNTSGAAKSGVPNITCNLWFGSKRLARPKSMSLILLPVLVTHKIFSGFISRCMMCFWCMYSTPSHIWRMNMAQTFSVNSKSSSMTRSNSSPPEILFEIHRLISVWCIMGAITVAACGAYRGRRLASLLQSNRQISR